MSHTNKVLGFNTEVLRGCCCKELHILTTVHVSKTCGNVYFSITTKRVIRLFFFQHSSVFLFCFMQSPVKTFGLK